MKRTYLILIAFVSLFNCNSQEPTQFPETALNDTFTTLSGESVTFQDILDKHKGKTIVIDVWASWCKDCIQGMPKVKALQENYKDVAYVFLSLDRKIEAWKNGINKYDVNGDHYYMHSGKKSGFGKFLKIGWIPRYMVINEASEIVVFDVIEADDKNLIEAVKN